jgi:hypothetical protein
LPTHSTMLPMKPPVCSICFLSMKSNSPCRISCHQFHSKRVSFSSQCCSVVHTQKRDLYLRLKLGFSPALSPPRTRSSGINSKFLIAIAAPLGRVQPLWYSTKLDHPIHENDEAIPSGCFLHSCLGVCL